MLLHESTEWEESSGRKQIVNAHSLRLQCAREPREGLFGEVLMRKSEAIVQRGKERSRIRTPQTNNRRGILGIRRID